MCGCPRSGQETCLDLTVQVLKITFLREWRGTPCLVASYAGLQSPELGSRQLQLSFILWVKRKKFQNACSTVCLSAGHLNKPIPKKVMDDGKNNFFETMLRRNLQALNTLKLLLWSKQNYKKNDQQWEETKKKVKLEKDDSKIWLNSTAPPSVKNCSFLPLNFPSNCREMESLDFLWNTLLL